MTKTNLPLKVTATLAALAVTAITAPTAFAAEHGISKASAKVTQNLSAGFGREHNTRGARGNRANTNRDRGTNRTARTADRTSTNRGSRGFDSYYPGRLNSATSRGLRTASVRNTLNSRNIRRGLGFSNSGFYSPYRGLSGISFSFGTPGFSSYRWASSPYSLYRPGRLSYASYSSGTSCQRVIVDGFQYGTLRPVSVKRCYNPWDGYYIIQGSERVATTRW